jgi:hypothetical protein
LDIRDEVLRQSTSYRPRVELRSLAIELRDRLLVRRGGARLPFGPMSADDAHSCSLPEDGDRIAAAIDAYWANSDQELPLLSRGRRLSKR